MHAIIKYTKRKILKKLMGHELVNCEFIHEGNSNYSMAYIK